MSRAPRQRLDQLLVERGLAPTRTRAQALVLAGHVRVGAGDAGRTDRKPGDLLGADEPVVVLERDAYVSRGGHKLEAALDAFAIAPEGRVCLDVGASTGGLTDVLLQRGARRTCARHATRIESAGERLRRAPLLALERRRARLDHAHGRLRALSPRATLERGYAIVRAGTEVVREPPPPGTEVGVEVAGGRFGARAE